VSAPENPKDDSTPAGRVKHDSSGRAVWEWAVDTGRHALDSTSRLLKRLEMPGLSLLDDEKEKQKAKAEAEREAGFTPYGEVDPRAGAQPPKPSQPAKSVPTFGGRAENDPLANSRQSFNPYNKHTPAKGGAAPNKPAVPRITQPAKPTPKPGILARLFGKK
jgi:hypothetical protein